MSSFTLFRLEPGGLQHINQLLNIRLLDLHLTGALSMELAPACSDYVEIPESMGSRTKARTSRS